METQTSEYSFEKVWQLFQEADRRFQKSEKEFEELRNMFKETDRRFKETDKKFDKYFGKVKELDRNWGKLVEALVRPSVAAQFQKRGFGVRGSSQRFESEYNGDNIEIDILLKNGDSIIVVEVKTTLTVDDVKEHIKKHLKPFKLFFPEYRDKKIYGAVAYIHIEENADRFAYKNGLFVLTFTTGDMVEIKNDMKFVPKVWEGLDLPR